jgi:hypothetical protein
MAELYPSEHVLWTGAPTRIPMFEPIDLVLIPFMTLWTGLAAFDFKNAMAHRSSGGFLAGIFVAVGMYMLVGRLIVRFVALRSSQYTVTDRRLIVNLRVFGRPREFTEYLRNLKPPTLREHRDGLGTIRFGDWSMQDIPRDAMRSQLSQVGDPFVLHGVQHAQYVRDIIATAQSEIPRA